MANRSLNEIEDQVERDRADLARSLDLLSETLSPTRLKGEATRTAEAYAKDIGGQACDAARENPAAFALVGAGLALLLSGAGRRDENDGRISPGPKAVPPLDAMDGFDERLAKAEAKLHRTRYQAPPSRRQTTARQMRDALQHGLDKLPKAARKRVMDARTAAIDAQEAVERRAARVARKSSAMVNDQPIAVGAAAFGIGALIATVLPGTEQEDEAMGRTRDTLMKRARDALQSEMEALHDNASADPAHSAASGPRRDNRARAAAGAT